MEIVSSYVREQERYTKNNLRDIFSFADNEAERFIKNLKSFGVLKSVRNSNEQMEISDLTDEDLEIINDSAESGDCLYVFTYVGIITCGNRIVKVYPKYLLSKDTDHLENMKQVLKVLKKYSRSKEQIVNVFNGNGENRSFNMLAVILYLLNDYYEYGIYTNSENIIEINGDGDILWEKTIDESFAMLQDNKPYYMELFTGRTADDDMDYFKRLHECILTECSEQLHETQLDILFDIDQIALSEEKLNDFGDTDYILERLQKELKIQFNTRRQILLKTLYAYVSQSRRLLEDNNSISMYGTTAFHSVWEKVCAEVFDNKLNISLGKLNMSSPIAEGYEPDEMLKDIIEKPKWQGTDTEEKEAQDTLIPDLISILKVGNVDYFLIFDAKYYNLRLEHGKTLSGNPGVGDVTKQYMYQLAYKNFIKAHNIAVVKNCFLIPTEKDDIINKGIAKMSMLEALGLENIQIRLLPARMMYEYYLSHKKIDIGLLEL